MGSFKGEDIFGTTEASVTLELLFKDGETSVIPVCDVNFNSPMNIIIDGATVPFHIISNRELNIPANFTGKKLVKLTRRALEPSSIESIFLGTNINGLEVIGGSWLAAENNTAITNSDIDDDGTVQLSIQVTGPLNVYFDWKTSSEEGWDFGNFAVNGINKKSISGETGWVSVGVSINITGLVTLTWNYSKDSSESAGSDQVFLRNLNLGPYSPIDIVVGDDVQGTLDPTSYTIVEAEGNWNSNGNAIISISEDDGNWVGLSPIAHIRGTSLWLEYEGGDLAYLEVFVTDNNGISLYSGSYNQYDNGMLLDWSNSTDTAYVKEIWLRGMPVNCTFSVLNSDPPTVLVNNHFTISTENGTWDGSKLHCINYAGSPGEVKFVLKDELGDVGSDYTGVKVIFDGELTGWGYWNGGLNVHFDCMQALGYLPKGIFAFMCPPLVELGSLSLFFDPIKTLDIYDILYGVPSNTPMAVTVLTDAGIEGGSVIPQTDPSIVRNGYLEVYNEPGYPNAILIGSNITTLAALGVNVNDQFDLVTQNITGRYTYLGEYSDGFGNSYSMVGDYDGNPITGLDYNGPIGAQFTLLVLNPDPAATYAPQFTTQSVSVESVEFRQGVQPAGNMFTIYNSSLITNGSIKPGDTIVITYQDIMYEIIIDSTEEDTRFYAHNIDGAVLEFPYMEGRNTSDFTITHRLTSLMFV